MKDVVEILRRAYIAAIGSNVTDLSGNTINVYDKVPNNAPDNYIRISGQTSDDSATDKQEYGHFATISLTIVCKFNKGLGGQRESDNITNQVTQLIRTRNTLNLAPYHYMITSRKQASNSFTEEVDGGHFYNRLITFSHIIGEHEDAVSACTNLIASISTNDLNTCILPSYDFSKASVTDNLTAQQQDDLSALLCDDATFELRDTQNNLLNSGTIPSGGSETITAPNGQLNINQAVNALQILSGGTSTLLVKDTAGIERGEMIGGEWIVPADMLVDFLASDTNPEPDTLITFTSLIQQATATQFAWNFGDGNFSELENPTHQYANEGTYNVRLLAANAENKGGFELKENYIVVEFDLLLLTRNYEDRVDADGGEVLDLNKVDDFYKYISETESDLYARMLLFISSKYGGLIKDGDNKVSVAFDLSSKDINAVQNTGVNQPLFDANKGFILEGEKGLLFSEGQLSDKARGVIFFSGELNDVPASNRIFQQSDSGAGDGIFLYDFFNNGDGTFKIRVIERSNGQFPNNQLRSTQNFPFGELYKIAAIRTADGWRFRVNGVTYTGYAITQGSDPRWFGQLTHSAPPVTTLYNTTNFSVISSMTSKGVAAIDFEVSDSIADNILNLFD